MIAFARITAFFYLCLFACAIFAQSVTPRTSSLFEGVSRVNQVAYADQQACATAATAILTERLAAKQYNSRMKLRCEASSLIEIAAPAPNPGQGAVWRKVADEVASPAFTVPALSRVRYGLGTAWTELIVIGSGTCSNAFFGADPLRGQLKVCEVLAAVTPTPVVEAPASPGLGKLPANPVVNAGSPVARISATTARGDPASDGVGAFRTVCQVSHFAFDDPIVYPGQPGRSHLHMFFGNTGARAASTWETISTAGSSTCAGGILNRSAYWVPAMIDTATNQVVMPISDAVWYYKVGYRGVSASAVQPIPRNLRIIAGDASSSSEGGEGVYKWVCHNNYPQHGQRIQNCAVGDSLEMRVAFPQCWDGKNLDSPDHKSHMAYANNGCPASHPVALPELSLNILFAITKPNQAMTWRLSSDTYTGPAGYSSHADFWAAWDDDIMSTFVRNCLNQGKDCHAYLLGDGRTLN